jgi:3-carboxy-cis,cis-muconate cycloisomerase
LFGWRALDSLFSARSIVQQMLDVEAALARAEAATGVIPHEVMSSVVSKCDADLFDLNSLAQAGVNSGNIAIPLIKALTALVAEVDNRAAGYVHWGATSQDIIDTALVLQLRQAMTLIESDLSRLCESISGLVKLHKRTPAAGRTWMQHAVPIVLGMKFAGWLDALHRHLERIQQARERLLVIQLGGAAGSLASLGAPGIEVQRAFAAELGLGLPAIPWHSHRDRLVEAATVLGLLTGTLGKIARDLSILSQTEIGEVLEPSSGGRGESSAMPQKRNQVTAAVVLSAAIRAPGLVSTMLAAMPQENERGLGGWHAEWETLPELVRLAGGALHHLAEIAGSLEIHPDRMLQNLQASNGLIFSEPLAMALAMHVGRPAAYAVVESCAREALSTGESLRGVAARNDQVTRYLSQEDLDRLFDSLSYYGSSDEFIERVLKMESAGFSTLAKIGHGRS